MVNVAVLGYGTIGSGVVEVLQTNTEVIAQRAGEEIAVKYILDLRDFSGNPNADKVVHDYDIIDKDEDSIRFYYLGNNYKTKVEHYGVKESLDMEGVLMF